MAEKEYIERWTLIREMQDCKYAEPSNDFQRGVNSSIDILITGFKHLPAADVVEVVRCKDCAFCHINSFGKASGVGSCRGAMKRIVLFDDFCSYGERKEQK